MRPITPHNICIYTYTLFPYQHCVILFNTFTERYKITSVRIYYALSLLITEWPKTNRQMRRYTKEKCVNLFKSDSTLTNRNNQTVRNPTSKNEIQAEVCNYIKHWWRQDLKYNLYLQSWNILQIRLHCRSRHLKDPIFQTRLPRRI